MQINLHRTGVAGAYWIGDTGMIVGRCPNRAGWEILPDMMESAGWYEEHLEVDEVVFPTLRAAGEFMQALFALCPPPEVEVLNESQLDIKSGTVHGHDRDYRLLHNGGTGLNRWVVFCEENVIAVASSLWDVRRQVARHERRSLA